MIRTIALAITSDGMERADESQITTNLKILNGEADPHAPLHSLPLFSYIGSEEEIPSYFESLLKPWIRKIKEEKQITIDEISLNSEIFKTCDMKMLWILLNRRYKPPKRKQAQSLQKESGLFFFFQC